MILAASRLFVVSYVVLWVVVLMLAVVCLALAQQIGLINVRLPPTGGRTVDVGPDIGTAVMSRSVETIDGRDVSVGGENGRPTLILALSSTCTVCADAAVALRSVARKQRHEIDVLIVGLTDSVTAITEFARVNKLERFSFTLDPDLRTELGLRTAPFGIVLDEHGVVRAKGIVNHLEHLESLVEADQRTPDWLPVELGESNGTNGNGANGHAHDEGALR